jgi:1-acyl-sn-glycerol-3-phosphate acyltransferase
LIIIAVLRGLLAIISMLIWVMAYGVKSLFVPHSAKRAFNLRRTWLKYIAFPFLNIKVTVEGKPASTAAIYMCNHRAFTDPMIICKYLDAFVIAKAEVGNYPIINKGAEVTGVLYVKRESKDSRTAVRDKMVEIIDSGHNVLVFPEGTVGIQRHTLPFRMGIFKEAVENNLAVIPMSLEYRHESDLWLNPNFILQGLKQLSKWQIEAKLTFGPILHSDDVEALKDKAETWVNTTLAAQQKGWSKIDFSKYDNAGPLYEYKNKEELK